MIEIINKPLFLHLVGYLYNWQMGFNSVFKGLSTSPEFHLILLPFSISSFFPPFPSFSIFFCSPISLPVPLLLPQMPDFFPLFIFLNIIRFYASSCSLIFLFPSHVLLYSLSLSSSSFLTPFAAGSTPLPHRLCSSRARPTQLPASDTIVFII